MTTAAPDGESPATNRTPALRDRLAASTISAVFVLALSPAPARAQFSCDDQPLGVPQSFRTAVRGGSSLSGDPFQCGPAASPTPATCTLYNRVYPEQESSCINRQQGPNLPDYLPSVYGSSDQNYEIDVISVSNWAGTLGDVGQEAKVWIVLWDHILNPTTPDYIGYYAAQSDLVIQGETGHHRFDPCTGGTLSFSCAPLVKPNMADDCNPTGTPLGTLQNLGSFAPVPVPRFLAFLGDAGLGFADPAGRIALEWEPACAWTQGSDTVGFAGTAPEPVIGYRLEVFVDRNGNGIQESAGEAGWDPLNRTVAGGCASGPFTPLLDIAPLGGDITGSRQTRSTVVDLGDYTGAGQPLENPAAIEAITFRLRILFHDDRFHDPVGGEDLMVDPVCSAPSAMGFPVGNPALFGGTSGAVPDGNAFPGVPLQVVLEANGDVTLSWGPSCNSGDSDYVVYEGVLGSFGGHTPRFCSTGGATSITFTPAAADSYYLVGPRNTQMIGSLGLAGDGSERPAGPAPCGPQNFACSAEVLAPLAVTDPATGVGVDVATLNGSVTPNGFDTDAYFEWGTTPAYGSITPARFIGNGETAVPVSVPISGLAENTVHHFRIVATNPIGTSLGSDISFTTAPLLAPTVTTLPPTGLTHESATLQGTVNPNGAATTVQFEWGTTSAYGNVTSPLSAGSGATLLPFTDFLFPLTSETTYHYRAVAWSVGGTTFGGNVSFVTDPVPNNLLRDGSFTESAADWTRSGDLQIFNDSGPTEFRTAPGYAVGGVDRFGVPIDGADGRVFQDVSIPGSATSTLLTFWYNITTAETGSSTDQLRVTIRDPQSDSFLATMINLGPVDASPLGSYQVFTTDVSAYIGQTVRLDFHVFTDASNPTAFRIDDVSLTTD